MKRQKADNGKEAGMIHSWRCSEGKSYITVHAVFISSANKYMFLWILKDPFERLLAGPGKPSRLKAPSAFSPLSQALWHFQWVGALTTFLFPEWFPPASNSKRGTPVLSTSAYHSASRALPGATSSPHKPRHSPFLSLWALPPTASSLPFLLSSSVLEAYWRHSLQGRIKPSHASHTLNSLVWNERHHLHGICCLCLWVIRCLLRGKEPLQRSWSKFANEGSWGLWALTVFISFCSASTWLKLDCWDITSKRAIWNNT